VGAPAAAAVATENEKTVEEGTAAENGDSEEVGWIAGAEEFASSAEEGEKADVKRAASIARCVALLFASTIEGAAADVLIWADGGLIEALTV
jgi:hypothetical protein